MPFYTRPRIRVGTGLSVIDNRSGKVPYPINIASRFIPVEQIRGLDRLVDGHVNETFLVSCVSSSDNFILQRLNTRVFPGARGLMANLELLYSHLPAQSFLPRPRPTLANRFYWHDKEEFWRAFSYIGMSRPGRGNGDSAQAAEAGKILGRFHRLTADMDCKGFVDPLPGFHVTPSYLAHYDKVRLEEGDSGPRERRCHDFIGSGRSRAGVLESAREGGELELRIIHGDPRLANILFSRSDGGALALIDLDTVGPGLVLWDIADLIRSCSRSEIADEPFVTSCCRAALAAYLAEAGSLLTPGDLAYLYQAIWLLPFELGLRFFSDYLAGNRYFQVNYEKQNLDRAESQFDLAASIENQEDDLRWIIDQQISPYRRRINK